MPKEIYYYPFSSGVNKYSERMLEILSSRYEVKPLNFNYEAKRFFSEKKGNKDDVAIINWLENKLINMDSGSLSVVGSLKLFFALFVLKRRFKKIIYIRHNIYPHNTNSKSIKKIKWLIGKMCDFVDVTAVHAPINEIGEYIPHPLYEFPIKGKNNRNTLPNKPYLIFGRIEKYKKIDLVIDSFPEDKELMIVGACQDKEYEAKIRLLASTKSNVKIISSFLTDEEAAEIFDNSAALLLCHADEDMIVSGSFFYSLTQQLPVLAINTPFLSWTELELGSRVIKNFNSISEMMSFISNESSINSYDNVFDEAVIHRVNELFGDLTIADSFDKLINDTQTG